MTRKFDPVRGLRSLDSVGHASRKPIFSEKAVAVSGLAPEMIRHEPKEGK